MLNVFRMISHLQKASSPCNMDLFSNMNDVETNADGTDTVFVYADLVDHSRSRMEKWILDSMVHISYVNHDVLRNNATFLHPGMQTQKKLGKGAIVSETFFSVIL